MNYIVQVMVFVSYNENVTIEMVYVQGVFDLSYRQALRALDSFMHVTVKHMLLKSHCKVINKLLYGS